MITFTMDQIEAAAQSKVQMLPDGVMIEYRKDKAGEWIVDHVLTPDPEKRESLIEYPDGTSEIVKWGKVIK